MTRAGALDVLDTNLSSITIQSTTPSVYRGEPLAIAQSPCIGFWLESGTQTAMTLANAGSTTVWTIRVYFRLQLSGDMREQVEEDVWQAMYDVSRVLLGDATLGGNVDDLRVGGASAGYVEMSGGVFRTVTIPIEVDILTDVTIAP